MKISLPVNPCPVCGKRPKAEQTELGYQTEVNVYCERMFRKCHALVRTLYYDPTRAEKQAVELWNSIKPGMCITDVSGYRSTTALEG